MVRYFLAATLCVLSVLVTAASAQREGVPITGSSNPGGGLGIADILQGSGPMAGFAGETDHVTLSAAFHLVNGSRDGTLTLTASCDAEWHVYSITQKDGGPQRSKILVAKSADFELLGDFQAEQPPAIKSYEYFDVPVEEHAGVVTWSAPLRIASDAKPDQTVIHLEYSGQACTDAGACIPISKRLVEARLAGGMEQFPESPAQKSPPAKESATPANAPLVGAKPATALDPDKIRSEDRQGGRSHTGFVLLTAFTAGFLLNFMPCVLPVIGLKVMAFVQQAGDSRRRVFALNVWYSLGLMTVFMVLATLAVSVGLGWGQQFSSVTFNVVLSSVVFAFALSFLGVWEIPIPGFVGSSDVQSLADKEGPAGAFVKGILTTVLATPCSGPMLTPALTWAVSQPPLITYAGFACVGLGMASPYLLIGIFPKCITFLPKPGAWMDTFKQLMGFVLIGTVVFLLTFMPIPYVVPTVAFLIGLWAVFWFIGRISLTEPFLVQFRGWLLGVTFACLIGLVSFAWLLDIMQDRFQRAVEREVAARNLTVQSIPIKVRNSGELAWQPFSLDLLTKLTATGTTVLVDFTADWCLTCKSNERLALNQHETKQYVEANGIATLKADKTHPAPEVDEFLRRLGNRSGSIPFYAIFPAGNPNRPITLDGLFTSPQPLVEAMEKAVRRGGP
jgi:thiol:disulfide interchange protein DsbD